MPKQVVLPVAALLLLPACLTEVSPQPDPVDGSYGFDVSAITLDAQGEETMVIGAAGALLSAPGSVMVDNLDRGTRSPTVEVGEDGSFMAVVEGSPSDTFRIHGRGPLDLVDVTAQASRGGATDVVEQLDCLLPFELLTPFSPALVFGADPEYSRRELVLTNQCAEDVRIAELVLLFDDAGFELTSRPDGATLAVGQRITLEVVFECEGAGERHDLVRLSTDRGRCVVTLWGSC